MKIKTKESGPCRIELTIESDAEEVRPDYETTLKEWMKRAQVPGFRAGKAPKNVIERHYRGAILESARDTILRRLYREALKEKEIAPVAIVDISEVDYVPERGIRFKLMVDVPPEFKLPKYKGLTLAEEKVEIGEKEIDERLEQVRTMMARFEDAGEEDAVERGDIACVDYTANIEGQALCDMVSDCDRLGGASDFWVQVDEPEFIPGLALALVGMKAGESRDVEVTFPDDFHVEAVRGRKAIYNIAVKAVRRKVMPELDDEFLKQMNVENMGAFRERIRADLTRQAEQDGIRRRSEEAIRQLLRKSRFELPASVVQEETGTTLRMMMNDVLRRGGTREAIEQNRDELLKTAAETSEERVRTQYVLGRIAREENLRVGDEEVDEYIARMAAANGGNADELRKKIEERQGLERVRSDLLAEKAMDLILAEAKYK